MAEQTNQQPAWFQLVARHRYLRYLVLAALFVAAVWVAFPALMRMHTLLEYSYPHDGLEGTLLYEARLLRAGQPLYQPIEPKRFISAPYPPVHYLALALFDLIPGGHVFWGGRLASLLAAFGVALFAALLVRRAGSPWAVACLAAALVLSIPPLQLWGTRIKPDMLALLFTAAGLYCASREVNTQAASSATPTRFSPFDLNLSLAAICFACGFFTKQTAVAGPLAAGLALLAADIRDWYSREPQSQEPKKSLSQSTTRFPLSLQASFVGPLPIRWRTVIFGAAYLALALGMWAILDLITARQYTLHVWWGGERTRWWSYGLFSKIATLLMFWWPQMLLALLAVPLSIRRRGLFVPVCYALIAPLTLLGAGETGSHHNHLLETHLALAVAGCAAVGVAVRGWGDKETRRQGDKETRRHVGGTYRSLAFTLIILMLTGAQVFQTTRPPDWYTGELMPEDPPERFLNFIRNTPGEILADDTGLLFQAGRELRYDDPSTMGPAAMIGAWDQRGLLDDIAQKRFSAIMIPVNLDHSDQDASGRWTPEMLAAIKQHYQLKFHDTINTYVPR